MQTRLGAQNGEPRLRVVFAGSFTALDLPAGATLADIADRVTRLARRRHDAPLAIDVRMAAPRTFPAFADAH